MPRFCARASYDIKDLEFMEGAKLLSVKDFKDYLRYNLSLLDFKPTGRLTSDQRDLVASVISASLTHFRERGGNERTIKPALDALGFTVDDKRALKKLMRHVTGQTKVNELLIKESDVLVVKLRAEEQAAKKALAVGDDEGYQRAAVRYRLMKVLEKEIDK
jgi:hypothetical protein